MGDDTIEFRINPLLEGKSEYIRECFQGTKTPQFQKTEEVKIGLYDLLHEEYCSAKKVKCPFASQEMLAVNGKNPYAPNPHAPVEEESASPDYYPLCRYTERLENLLFAGTGSIH